MNIFISCIPGLEPALEKELESLGVKGQTAYGGVSLTDVTFDQIYDFNLMLRTASRVLISLAKFPCTTKEELYDGACAIEWERYFSKMPTFAIDATVVSHHFNNSLFAAQVVKDAICDVLRKKMGVRPSVETRRPEVQINLYLDSQTASIAFDSSGVPLHERGYRKEQVKAPLRENLAAGLLLLTGYSGSDLLVDPCAGSGTFLLEAAMMATNTPPNILRRRFGFMGHPGYSEKRWLEVRAQWIEKKRDLPGKILGIERDPASFRLMEENIARAGFAGKITSLQADFRTAQLPFAPTCIITNPPYGKRLSEEKALEGLYQALGQFMKQKSHHPGVGAIFTASAYLTKKIGLKSRQRFSIMNGGMECRLLVYDLFTTKSA